MTEIESQTGGRKATPDRRGAPRRVGNVPPSLLLASLLWCMPATADEPSALLVAPLSEPCPVSARIEPAPGPGEPLGPTLDDAHLSDVQGKGADATSLQAPESVAVILWDEPGQGGRSGTRTQVQSVTGSNNVQTGSVTIQRH